MLMKFFKKLKMTSATSRPTMNDLLLQNQYLKEANNKMLELLKQQRRINHGCQNYQM